jgi:RNA polymerase sigma factor (sigma-70 family)
LIVVSRSRYFCAHDRWGYTIKMTPYTHAEREKWFQRIVETHRGILYKVARMYCPLESDREDLIQEILLQIWQSAHRYNPQFNLSTWLYRIALNVAISFYRKNTARQPDKMPIHEALTGMAAPESAPQEHQLQLLEQFIQELNHFDKALMLLYLEGKPQSDIAEILGISVSNVSTKVGRIKEKLKKRFTQHPS